MGKLNQPGFAALAQIFVEATSPLVSNRTINIMDLDGTIIASTEKERIGTYHHGAKRVAETGEPVIIDAGNVKDYPGAKEGANLPILDQDQIIGVVGLYGREEEIRDAANLLRVYVTQFFHQQTRYQERAYRREACRQLLQLLLAGRPEQQEERENLARSLGVRLHYPLVLVGLRWNGKNALNRKRTLLEQLEDGITVGKGKKQDTIFGEVDQQLLLLHSLTREEERYLAAPERVEKGLLHQLVHQMQQDEDGFLAISQCCRNEEALPEARREVNLLLERPVTPLASIENARFRVQYLLERLRPHGGASYVGQMRPRVQDAVTDNQWNQLLETAACYYEEQGSVQKAAQRLAIHKNTLQYRMKRLYEVLGLEEAMAFEKEFLITLILLERKREENK